MSPVLYVYLILFSRSSLLFFSGGFREFQRDPAQLPASEIIQQQIGRFFRIQLVSLKQAGTGLRYLPERLIGILCLYTVTLI